jgi:hypothetical protein
MNLISLIFFYFNLILTRKDLKQIQRIKYHFLSAYFFKLHFQYKIYGNFMRKFLIKIITINLVIY